MGGGAETEQAGGQQGPEKGLPQSPRAEETNHPRR